MNYHDFLNTVSLFLLEYKQNLYRINVGSFFKNWVIEYNRGLSFTLDSCFYKNWDIEYTYWEPDSCRTSSEEFRFYNKKINSKFYIYKHNNDINKINYEYEINNKFIVIWINYKFIYNHQSKTFKRIIDDKFISIRDLKTGFRLNTNVKFINCGLYNKKINKLDNTIYFKLKNIYNKTFKYYELKYNLNKIKYVNLTDWYYKQREIKSYLNFLLYII